MRGEAATLRARFLASKPSPSAGVFVLERLTANAFFSATSKGNPCLVFLLKDSPPEGALVLGAVRLDVFPRARVRIRGRVGISAIAVVELTDPAKAGICGFLLEDLVAGLRADRKALATSTAVRARIDRWREAFAAVRELDLNERIGLWGELELLERIGPSEAGLHVWHGPEAKTFDFAGKGVALEVKTSTKGHIHRFAANQLEPLGSSRLYVASLSIRENLASGDTIRDKIRRIERELPNPYLFHRKLMLLGVDPGFPFQEKFSLVDFRMFDARDLPRATPSGPRVSEIRFVSNLEGLKGLSRTRETRVVRHLGA